MTTLAEMRTRVRDFVRDTNADETKRKVSDAELNGYLQDGLSDYSWHFPLQKVADTSPPVTLPADAVPDENAVDFVEVSGVLWTLYKVEEGSSLPTTGKFWYWRGGSIELAPTPTSSVSVWYRALHPFPAEDADFTLPSADEELLVLYTAAKFHQKVGTVAAKLDRFKERGERDDNPLIMMHQVIMAEYHAKVSDRLRKGTVRLRKTNA